MASNPQGLDGMDNISGLLKSFAESIFETQKSMDAMTLKQIMELEIVIEDMLRLVRRVHNRLTLVHKLPTELLCSIFDFVRDPDEDYTEDAFNFSHVCRDWRNTAISYPPLWSDIFIAIRASEAHAECLERSKHAPLTVTIQVPDRPAGEDSSDSEDVDPEHLGRVSSNNLDALEMLANHGHRIQTMDIHLPADTYRVLEKLKFPAPQLERFACRSTDGHSIVLPKNTFRGCLPLLREVVMVNVEDSATDLFSNLTTMKLSTEREGTMNAPRFLGLLRRCPLLKHLIVEGYRFMGDEDLGSLVPLHGLAELSLSRTQSGFVLSHLDIPAVSKFVNHSPTPPIAGNGILAALPSDTSRLNFTQPLTTLSIVEDSDSKILDLKGTYHNAGKISGFAIHEHTDQTRFELSNFLSTTLDYVSHLSLSQLTSLTLDRGGPPLDHLESLRLSLMGRVFQSLPSLQRLVVLDYCWHSILEPLVHKNDTSLCLDLQTITVYITDKTFGDISELIRTIVNSRASTGRSLSIAEITPSDANHLTPLWKTYCNDHGIATFVDRSTIDYVASRLDQTCDPP